MNLSIVIATHYGRGRQAHRAVDAYLRETVDPQLIVQEGESVAEAWRDALAFLDPTIDAIHFAIDTLEPHPGWWEAARGAIGSGCVPSPVIWTTDGVELDYRRHRGATGRDWGTAVGSDFPTLAREQLRAYGVPPLAGASCDARFVQRTDYAFTRHAD